MSLIDLNEEFPRFQQIVVQFKKREPMTLTVGGLDWEGNPIEEIVLVGANQSLGRRKDEYSVYVTIDPRRSKVPKQWRHVWPINVRNVISVTTLLG